MSTTRPFAYNTGSAIPGTEQLGDIAYGFPTDGFSSTGLAWWNGPDEDLGYVIAQTVPSDTQPTEVPEDALTLSSTYKGVDITLNTNQSASQIFGYQQSVLGETLISGTNKVMFSVLCNLLEPQTLIGSHLIGVGTTSMNYSSQYGAYPGNDIYSIGFSDDGNYYFDGSSVQSGLPTWTDGDIIDIVISHGQYWWIRVNGGDWNNNPSANPTTLSNGLTMNGVTNFYPVLCPSYQGTMTVLNYPKYGVPSDYNFLGNVSASVGFFTSSDLTDSSFINIANSIARAQGAGPFVSGSSAKSWLNTNGFWTSYVGSTGATGSLFITITQNGPDVVLQGSGSLNINDLTFATSGNLGGGGLGPQTATFLSGPNGAFDQYSGSISSPGTFGTGSGGASSSSTGNIFGVIYPGGPPHALVVPSGYTTGTALSGSMTFNSQTIAGLGLTEGTYNWTWGSGPNADGITMVIGGTGSTGSTGSTGGTGGTGDFNVTITQVGNDVVWSGSGSFNLDSLTLVGSLPITSGFNASTAIWIAGASTTPPGPTGQQYGGASLTYPTTFASGPQTGGPSTTTGSMFGVVTGGASGRTIVVPDGYVSGTTISGSTTYSSQTIAGMGLSGGTYTWSWGSGASTSTLVMTIG